MADSLAVISAQLRLQYPMPQYDNVGGDNVLMTQTRYDQWIADQAVAVRDQQLADEAAAAKRDALLAQIAKLEPILAKMLAVPVQNLTNAETRTVLQEIVVWALPKIIAEKNALL